MQHTLDQIVEIRGIGLHSNEEVTVSVRPADPDTGIIFKRTDKNDLTETQQLIPARWDNVVDTRLCTVIGNEHGASVGTIEHLMAALRGCGIDNALIEIDGPEVPVLDGSSQIFVDAFEEAGVRSQSQPRRAIRVLKEVSYEEDGKKVTLSPSLVPTYSGGIEYANPAIGHQNYDFKLINGNFKHDLADCRTFCLLSDVEQMQANGLALGGSLENAIVVDDNGIVNPEGLRCHDEFIRHKLLDAVGDMALAGGLLIGSYEGTRAGHALNNKALRALFADDSAWEVIDLFVDIDEEDKRIYQQVSQESAVTTV